MSTIPGADLSPCAALSQHADALMTHIAYMRGLAAYAPMSVQIEVNNLQEVLDLLRHKLNEMADGPVDSAVVHSTA